MLIMYSRLTLGLTVQKFVRAVAFYVLLGWISTQIAFFTSCRPFRGYWQISPPSPQCKTYRNYAIVQAVFNISSHILILVIPFPLIFRLQVRLGQKIILFLIFSLGVFAIAAAILTKYFNLSDLYSSEYMIWYVREASAAVCVSNFPLMWPLFLVICPCIKRWTAGNTYRVGCHARGHVQTESIAENIKRVKASLPEIFPTFPRQVFDRIRGKKRQSFGRLRSIELGYVKDNASFDSELRPVVYKLSSRNIILGEELEQKNYSQQGIWVGEQQDQDLEIGLWRRL